MSSGDFYLNFLALVLSEILGGSEIYVRGAVPSCTPPSGNFFVPEASTNGDFNLNLLALLLSEILRGSEIYTRGPYAPCTLPSGKFFYSKRVLRHT